MTDPNSPWRPPEGLPRPSGTGLPDELEVTQPRTRAVPPPPPPPPPPWSGSATAAIPPMPSQVPPSPQPLGPGGLASRTGTSRTALIALVAVVVVAIGGAGAFLALRGGSHQKAQSPTTAASGTFDGVRVANAQNPALAPVVQTAAIGDVSQLAVHDLIEGTGEAVADGDSVSVNYVGALRSTGTVFDSSWVQNTGTPRTFPLAGVVPGFKQGILGSNGAGPMRIGGRRLMIIPSVLAYGSEARGAIPANSALVFVVDLVAFTSQEASPSATPVASASASAPAPTPTTPSGRQPITTVDVQTSDGATHRMTLWATDDVSDCAGHSYGKVAQYFDQHPCQSMRRYLWTLPYEGRTLAMTVETVTAEADSTNASAGDLYQLEQADGTGSVNDLLREGARAPGVSGIPKDEAFDVETQDGVVSVFDAWYVTGSTQDQDPDVISLETSLFLTDASAA